MTSRLSLRRFARGSTSSTSPVASDSYASYSNASWSSATKSRSNTPSLCRVDLVVCVKDIEEFFKALKTGCAFEKRQLESYDTLTVALGIFLPIAWQLLLLRHQAQTASDEPAERVLSPVQIQVLRARLPKLVPAAPTAADALRAVAYLGGHFIKRSPGWLVLGRGLQTLLELEVGWRLARGMELEL
jgi:hypothetical protein